MSAKGSINFSRAIAKLTDLTAKATVNLSRLSAKAIIGRFANLVSLINSAGVAENHQKNIGKVQADSSSVSDVDIKSLGKPLTETPSISEQHIVTLNKILTDSIGVSDTEVVLRDKGNLENPTVSDDEIFAIQKVLTNTVVATDDVDGVASIEDDQVAQLFKIVGNSSQIADSEVKLANKVVTNTAQIGDSGSIFALVQDYTVDSTYFLEDYVGTSQTRTF